MTAHPERPIRSRDLEFWLRERVAQLACLDSGGQIIAEEPLATYGLTSPDIVMLAAELEEKLGHPVSPMLIFRYPTLRLLLDHLAHE